MTLQGHSVGIFRLSIGIVLQCARFAGISSLGGLAATYPGGLSRPVICVMISILIFMLPGRRARFARRPLF
ncbi:hypothetical protein G3N96_35295 [Burkholderia sp. Se-20373]|uniref:hypothetical protein n=1 Tax=Burkholderia sp. Se-20373 TaxID=2703898 RepID=UPI00197EDB03|nr:hypothetical protein [Burkholderia sp. Se-20373]MBN3750642.1 hypothetical protein [Burkholderia sp. Se-20373]